ncbi:MAG: cob(I)yrinic acid a,c-diamide adenosyltransferase [Rikenellaceae bacterium]
MNVYTKKGDAGATSLIGGERVMKSDDRVEAYGTIDELTAFVGLLSDKMRGDDRVAEFSAELDRINSVLMNVEAHLAAGSQLQYPLPEIDAEDVELLERRIDEMQSELSALTKFTIPGGCELNSLSHVCRTVCRRGERRIAVVAAGYALDANVLRYVNRLSDYLYLLGRTLSARCGVAEVLWVPKVEK